MYIYYTYVHHICIHEYMIIQRRSSLGQEVGVARVFSFAVDVFTKRK